MSRMIRRMFGDTDAMPPPLQGSECDDIIPISDDEHGEGSDDSSTEPGDDQVYITEDDDDFAVVGNRTTGLPIDLTQDDEEDALQDEAHFQRDVSTTSAGVIGAGIPRNHEHLDRATTAFGVRIRPNDTVECTDNSLEHTAFLRIIFITKDIHGSIFLHGILLKRHRDVDRKISNSRDYQGLLHSLLPNKKNELCAMLRVHHRTADLALENTLETRNIQDVGMVRKVTFTNKLRHDLSGRTRGETYTSDQWKLAEEKGDLFCRWKYIEEVDTVKKKVVAFQIRVLQQSESDLGTGIAAERKFEVFRGSQSPSTASPTSTNSPRNKRKRPFEVITLDDSDSELDDFERSFQALGRKKGKLRRSQTTTQTTQRVMLRDDDGSEELLTYKRVEETASTRSRRRPHRQPETKKYVYADLCAGAGGTSGGAKAAGLKLKYLLDLEPDACKSLMLNFGGAATLKMDISAFATSSTVGGIVDVMHISFPCQGHSMLNRQQNPEQDARNISTAYGSLSLILQKCKPRIVTLEQVAGIMYRSDGQHLRGQIYEMVEAGYSVRWSLLNFADYGLVQPRPRVIVIASCAGQTLPPFPKPTHGNGPGLKRPTTIADILSQVPPQIPGIMGHAFTRNYKSYDPSVPLRGCITSGGVAKKSGNGYHPSGRRDFNLQEMAQMQGFRAEHRFYGGVTSIRKQIGNAYPSLVAEVVFRGVIKALEERDQKIEEWGKTIEL